MPQTYRVTAYIIQRVETLVVTDDEELVCEIAQSQIEDGDYKLTQVDLDWPEYELIHDANID